MPFPAPSAFICTLPGDRLNPTISSFDSAICSPDDQRPLETRATPAGPSSTASRPDSDKLVVFVFVALALVQLWKHNRAVLLQFCQWHRCSCLDSEECRVVGTSPYEPCQAHHSLSPCFVTLWNWFAVFERVFVCGCPRGSSVVVPIFPFFIFSQRGKSGHPMVTCTLSRDPSLSCSLRDMRVPT